MPFSLRRAQAADATVLAHIHIATWRATYQGLLPQTLLDELDLDARCRWWTDRLGEPNLVILVADAAPVVGFVIGGAVREEGLPGEAEIYALYVLPEAQRQGMGRALLSAAAAELAKQGYSGLGLWVLRGNPSRAFYDSLGGRAVAAREEALDGYVLEETGYHWESLSALAMAGQVT
jgi:ribosomal protein S18 acetylase RimI-like enzyme